MEQATHEFIATVLLGGNSFLSPPGSGLGVDLKNPSGIAVDQCGRIYVADTENDCVRVLPPGGSALTLDAGLGLTRPRGLVVDPASTLWVEYGDQYSRWARLMPDEGFETVLEGGHDDRPYLGASAIAFDSHSTLYFVDALNNQVFKLNDTGEAVVVAGSGREGFADGPASTAKFNGPRGLAVDAQGNLYVADSRNHRIRKVSPEGEVSTFAGSYAGHRDGQGREAELFYPDSLYMSPDGTLYVTDDRGNRIRTITPDAMVGTLIGTIEADKNHHRIPIPGEAVALAGDGSLLVVSRAYQAVLRVAEGVVEPRGPSTQPPGRQLLPHPPTVVTVAGGMRVGSTDGSAVQAEFNEPLGLAIAGTGAILVADSLNHRIRSVGTDGVTRTIAGSTCGTSDGVGADASFQVPAGLAIASSGAVFVADSSNDRLRIVTPTGEVTTVAGQDNWQEIIFHLKEGTTGVVLPNGTEVVQPMDSELGWIDYADGTAVEAKFNDPRGVVVDQQGNLLVADSGNGLIRRVDPAGNVFTLKMHRSDDTLVARWSGDQVQEDRLGQPIGVAIAADGTVYVSELRLSRVSRIAPDGEVLLVAGGQAGCSDGLGAEAQFDEPAGLAIGPDGDLYVADSKNHRICRITPQGHVQTVAGGECGYRDGRGEEARFNEPWGLAFDAAGNLLVSDRKNHCIRKLILHPSSRITEPALANTPNEATIIYAEAQHEVVRRKLTPFGTRLERWDQLPGRKIKAITGNEAWSRAIILHFEDAWVEIEGIGGDPFPYFKDELWGHDFHPYPSHLHGRIITSVVTTYDRPGGDVSHVRFQFDDGTAQWLEPFYGDGLRIS